MRLRDCKGIAESGVIRVSADELQPLWISDFYDGPLSGAVVHNGQFCWYVMANEEQEPYAEGWYRRYWLLALSAVQEDEERSWHSLFRQHVGTHWDSHSGPDGGRVLPQENHHLFYEPYAKRTPLELDDNDVVGWFQF